MKRISIFFFALGYLLAPIFCLAQTSSIQDVGLLAETVVFNESRESLPLDSDVVISFSVENYFTKSADIEVELLHQLSSIANTTVTVSANQTASGQLVWHTPKREGDLRLELLIADTSIDDQNEDNNLLPIDVHIGKQKIVQTPIVEPRVTVEPTRYLPEDISIEVSQLNWNSFSFRPTTKLEFEGISYIWNYGDGESGTAPFTQHTYTRPGLYTVRLEIVDANSQLRVTEATVHIGFFHLGNFQIWIIAAFLGVGIILSLLMLKFTDRFEHGVINHHDHQKDIITDVSEFDTIPEEVKDFDALAAMGGDSDSLAAELAILKQIEAKVTKKVRKKVVKKSTKKRVASKKKKSIKKPKIKAKKRKKS